MQSEQSVIAPAKNFSALSDDAKDLINTIKFL